jgi:hypothetical protein
MPLGRPSKYDPSFCEKIVALGKLGKSKAQIASELGVVRQTLDNWAAEHPEVIAALREAQEYSLAWWENMAQAVMIEPVPGWNATSFIFQMKNRFRNDYRDKIETNTTHQGEIAITGIERIIVDPNAST